MTHPWQPLLADASARFTDDRLTGFSPAGEEAAAAAGADVMAPLPELGLIEAAGSDAATFLHNQLTNDISGLDDGQSRLAGYCNPKGRMLGLVRVYRSGDRYGLLLPRELIAGLLPRLRMFVLRAKVQLNDRSDELLALGLAGDGAEQALSNRFQSLPDQPNALVESDDQVLIRLPGNRPRFLLLASAEAMQTHWQTVGERARPIGPEAWRLLDVRAGLPQVFGGTREEFIPQTVNLDLVDGVSFTKGCYPGQEIVARMHYLGSNKRRMYRVSLDRPPVPGTDVCDTTGALTGKIVYGAINETGRAEALAVLRIDKATSNNLVCDDQPLTLLDLPYEIPVQEGK